MRRHGGQTLFYQHQLDLVGLHGRVRGLRLFEPRLRFEVFLTLLIHRQILSDANVKGVRCSALNFMAECGQTRRPETWVLIKEETPLLDIAQQAFEEEKAAVHRILAMDLHAVFRKPRRGRWRIGTFNVVPHHRFRVSFIDLCWQASFAPLRDHGLCAGFHVIGVDPEAGKAAMRMRFAEVAALLNFGLNRFALAAAVGSYASLHGMKIGMIRGVLGCMIGLLLVNLMGAIRRYGEGIDLSRLSWENLDVMTSSFGGEFGVVYVLDYMATNPLPPPVPLDPWLVGIARLVPSFIWPEKPVAGYMTHVIDGATMAGADKAGIAAPQHVEMMLQAGWWGLLPLAFLYYWLACRLLRVAARSSFEVRLATYMLIPTFFGFYMQTRGYFFQVFVDFLFTLMPLLFLSGRRRRVAARRAIRCTRRNRAATWLGVATKARPIQLQNNALAGNHSNVKACMRFRP